MKRVTFFSGQQMEERAYRERSFIVTPYVRPVKRLCLRRLMWYCLVLVARLHVNSQNLQNWKKELEESRAWQEAVPGDSRKQDRITGQSSQQPVERM